MALLPLLLVAGAVAAVAAATSKKSEPEGGTVTPKRPQARVPLSMFKDKPLSKAQLAQLRQVLTVLFAMIGKDKHLTKAARLKAAAIMRTFRKPKTSHAISVDAALPSTETWPGSRTNVRAFVLKAYKTWLAHHTKHKTLPPSHKAPKLSAKQIAEMKKYPETRHGAGHFGTVSPKVAAIEKKANTGPGHF